MLILHIGFGKCGTTSLQKHVLPALEDMGVVDSYNPVEIKTALGLFRRGDRRQIPVLRRFFETHADRKILISLESLIGWNPAIWQERLDMNRAAFPADTILLITLRDPEGFLRSFYQQNLHQGHVVPPEEYLLGRANYDAATLTARPQIAEIFSVDDFHYRSIINDYAAAFSKTVVLSAKNLNTLDFLPALDIQPSADQLEQLRRNMNTGGVENRAYSKTAMAMTLGRERLLNKMGLKTLSSYDHDYRIRFLAPPATGKRASLPRRILRRVLRIFRLPRWRSLMSQGLDKMVPYKPYILPTHIPRGIHFEDNVTFHEDIRQAPDGYVVMQNTQASGAP